MLRIELVRAGRDNATFECVAENGVGDAVSGEAMLTVYDGKYHRRVYMLFFTFFWRDNVL